MQGDVDSETAVERGSREGEKERRMEKEKITEKPTSLLAFMEEDKQNRMYVVIFFLSFLMFIISVKKKLMFVYQDLFICLP